MMLQELCETEIASVAGGTGSDDPGATLRAPWLPTDWSDDSGKIGSIYGKLLGQTQAEVEKAMLQSQGEIAH